MEIELNRIIKVLIKRWWIIILTTVVFSLAAFQYTYYCITPVYTAQTTMFIRNTNNYRGAISSGDLASSQELLNTFTALLKSNNVMEKIAKQVNAELTASQISSMVSTNSVNKSGVINISVNNYSPYTALKVADAISNIVPNEIVLLIGAGNVELIDRAELPKLPSYPNINQNTIIAAMLGFIISCVVIILIEILDTRIRSEDDLKQVTNLPVIGLIPKNKKVDAIRG